MAKKKAKATEAPKSKQVLGTKEVKEVKNVLTTTAPKSKQVQASHWSTKERKQLADSLNTLLAACQVHYQKLHNYHWNVEGDEFFELHEITEQQYGQVHGDIDAIAERIRAFGERPLSTFAEYLAASPIQEDTQVPSAKKMAGNLLADYGVLIKLMYATADLADDLDDLPTESMMVDLIARFEKQQWMLGAFLK